MHLLVIPKQTNILFGQIVKARNNFGCIGLGWENLIKINLKVMYCVSMDYSSGSLRVLRAALGIRDQFPGDPSMCFSNGHFEVYLFVIYRNNILLKIIAEFL
jgi:hypothetical protein